MFLQIALNAVDALFTTISLSFMAGMISLDIACNLMINEYGANLH